MWRFQFCRKWKVWIKVKYSMLLVRISTRIYSRYIFKSQTFITESTCILQRQHNPEFRNPILVELPKCETWLIFFWIEYYELLVSDLIICQQTITNKKGRQVHQFWLICMDNPKLKNYNADNVLFKKSYLSFYLIMITTISVFISNWTMRSTRNISHAFSVLMCMSYQIVRRSLKSKYLNCQKDCETLK